MRRCLCHESDLDAVYDDYALGMHNAGRRTARQARCIESKRSTYTGGLCKMIWSFRQKLALPTTAYTMSRNVADLICS